MSALYRLKNFHLIQKLHIANAVFGLLTLILLIATARLIKVFISNGSASAGFGNYNLFSYPATYVYMLIPVICSFIYSIILAADPSPQYAGWKPSKTLIGSMICFVFTLFLAALLPAVPGADVILTPDSALSCTWVDFMSWRTIFNAPDLYPWVTTMDTACQCLRAADAFTWILMIFWMLLVISYIRVAKHAPPIVLTEKGSIDSDTKTQVVA